MKKVYAQPYITATLDELIDLRGEMLETAKKAMLGEYLRNPMFSIGTYDKDIDGIQFKHGELLRRFVCIPPFGQKQLVLSAISAIQHHKVDLMQLSVQWSPRNRRPILINAHAWTEGHKWVTMDLL